MPRLTSPVIPSGRLADEAQPRLRTGDGLTLRPWESTDAAALADAYRDPEIQRWHTRSMTELEARDWIAVCASEWAAETGAHWAVVDDDTLVARMAVTRLDLARGAAEASYWVVPSARGSGVAPRALRTVTRFMFDHVGLQRIELVHSTRNRPSCRVAEQVGYGLEGTMRRQALHTDGWHDMHLHARLRDDPGEAPA